MIVLDASIIIKWLIDEDGSGSAVRYRADHVEGVNQVAVPDLLFYELANVLSTKGALSLREAELGFSAIWNMELETHKLKSHDYLRACRFANDLDISAYDAAYVALADRLDVNLITADRKLAKKCRDLGFVFGAE